MPGPRPCAARRVLTHRDEDPRELAEFQRAVELYGSLSDARGEAEALVWLATFHQVVRGDTEAAVPLLDRSDALASQVGDKLTMSYAVRHLGFADISTGRLDDARMKLEQSVVLRRDIGFVPGEAAGILALGRLEHEGGRREQALARLDEAEQLALACGANGILTRIHEARAELT